MSRLLLPRGYRSAESLQSRLHIESEGLWKKRGQRRAVKLFHAMAEKVPAYKDFLKTKKFAASSVVSIDDFQDIPFIDKDNYLRKYPKEMLCWDGEFAQKQWVISSTSGSTGRPYYFPREQTQDWQYAVCAELYLRNNFQIHKKTTLYIVAFPMGAWIGGLYTYEALKIVAKKSDYSLSIITPGIHKKEIINAIKQLASSFDQIIIGAYAPFMKDIIDDGAKDGIDWASLDVGFVFSAEAFSENFRDYVYESTKTKNVYTASLNHYGTVDLGTMAHETPEAILIRRHLVENNNLTTLFPEKYQQPTFAQYNPELYYFEEQENTLFCSAYGGLPLVRYDLKDYGGVISRQEVMNKLEESGFNVSHKASKLGISQYSWNLPFVYIYERNDFSVSYYAFQVYPDTARRTLQQKKLKSFITGKFTMKVEYNSKGRQKLILYCELKNSVAEKAAESLNISDDLHKAFMTESSEYRETATVVGEVIKPIIRFMAYEDPLYFKPGTKQKWTITKKADQ